MPTLSGIVKDNTGAFAQRMVRAYRRDTGALIGQAVSNATTGAYAITTTYAGEHFVVCHDGTPTAADPLWDSVVLACHFDGTNGSTTFTDEKGHTLTANGNAQIGTAQSKFGGASAYFDGAGDYLSLANSSDFDFGSGDFTVEMWVYPTTVSGIGAFIGLANGWVSNSNYAFQMLRVDAQWRFDIVSDTTSYGGLFGVVTPNTWSHIAMVRSGSNLLSFVNGTLGNTASVAGITVNNPSGAILQMGRVQGYYDLAGYIDDLRITKGVARYTANFTPPTAAFLSNGSVTGGTENILAFDRVTPV